MEDEKRQNGEANADKSAEKKKKKNRTSDYTSLAKQLRQQSSFSTLLLLSSRPSLAPPVRPFVRSSSLDVRRRRKGTTKYVDEGSTVGV
jgi:hypothetical protein